LIDTESGAQGLNLTTVAEAGMFTLEALLDPMPSKPVHIYMYVYICIYLHRQIYTCLYRYICLYMYENTYVQAYLCVFINMHTYTHTI
jgi:hypothetical protein